MTKRSRVQRLDKRLKQKVKRIQSLNIAFNPNDLIKCPSYKDELRGVSEVKCVEIKPNEKRDRIENEANRPASKRYRYGVEISKFCAYLIAKHGDDYKAMERDPKNYYQKSAGSLKRMINNFNKFKVTHNAFELAVQQCEDDLKKQKQSNENPTVSTDEAAKNPRKRSRTVV